VRKHERDRPLDGSRRRWENRITLDFKGTRCESVDWIQMARNRVQLGTLLNILIKIRVPLKSCNFFTS
jgi:hypothetical protein